MKKAIVGFGVIVALLLAMVLVVGCGDDSNAATTASTQALTTTAPVSATTTQAPTTTTAAPTTTTAAPRTTTTEAAQVTFTYPHEYSVEMLEDGCRIATDYAGVEFLLVPKGRQRPTGYDDLTMITTPIERAVFMSATQVCCLRPLDALDVVCGVASDRDSWYVNGVKEAIDAGTIEVVATGMGEPDYEKIVALKPDIVFAYTESGPDSEKMYAKFKELGIPTFVENSWLEKDPMGRMELVKLMGAFLGMDAEAATYLEQAEAKVASLMDTAAKTASKPNVMYAMTMDGQTWYVTGGDAYTSKEVVMAGGTNVFGDLTEASPQVTPEEVYVRAKDADVWIFSSMITYFQGMDKLMESAPLLAETNPFKTGNVWLYAADYWQTVDLTDEVIGDLAAIIHPDLFPDYTVKHFVRAH